MKAPTFRIILRHEWRAVWADRTLPVLILLLLPLLALAVWGGARSAADRRAAVEAVVALDSVRRAELAAVVDTVTPASRVAPGADPRSPATLGTSLGAHAVMPVSALAPLAIGQSDLLPQTIHVTTRGVHTLGRADEIENPGNLLEGRFDMTFVVVWLLPLIVLGLGYNLLAGERDDGVLALLLSQPIRLWDLLAAKVVVGGGVTIGLALLAALAGLLLNGSDLLGGEGLLRLGLWTGVVTLWALFWFALAVAVNLRRWAAATNAVILASAWLGLVVVAPALVDIAARTLHPVPSRVELIGAIRTASNQASAEGAALLARYYEDHPELAPDDGEAEIAEFMARTYAVQDAIGADVAPLLAEYDRQLSAQQAIVDRYQWFLPSVAVHEALTHLAGTGTRRYRAFHHQVQRFHAEWQAHFLPRIFQRRYLSASELRQAPAFRFEEESPVMLVGAFLPALASLSLWLLLLWLGWIRIALRRVAP